MPMPGDFIILNDVIGCIQTLDPLTVLCDDGKVRSFVGSPTTIINGQQLALALAEKVRKHA